MGGSYQASFEVGGDVTADENVVVDFSRVKKDLKAVIDGKEVGLDHKLWVINGYSNLVEPVTFFTGISPSGQEIEYCSIYTPSTALTVPRNAVAIFDAVLPEEDETWADEEIVSLSAGQEAARLCTEAFKSIHPGVSRITCEMGVNAHTSQSRGGDTIGYFRYVHGLKNSSSWGCQNIAHGHLSFIQFSGVEEVALC